MSHSKGCEADYSDDKYVFSFLNLPVLSYEELYLHSFKRERYVEESSVRGCFGSSPVQYSVIEEDIT